MKQGIKQQAGFTLIELVVVIVILGILAATALPRFVDLSGDAEQAAVEGFTGAINGGNSINYATFLARGAGGDDVVDTTGGCEKDTANLLLQQAMPAAYVVTGTDGNNALDAGENSTDCVLAASDADDAPSASFTLTGFYI